MQEQEQETGQRDIYLKCINFDLELGILENLEFCFLRGALSASGGQLVDAGF
ncbi:MAG TPA: hypothetical protein DEF41_00095 [Desulfovibrio sp.]|uniref:Uncharacterized protein n=1 Tax=Nitratidesulfovibrio vulgaris (strain ATCC 29579 / DSM 644 / CCUG 34227 / NCIMB 8303 / VKM B-1760 / Hildenborough) TaxID=882 RepID=Q72EG0_NITV2|nr:hypothetical protein DVU_0618 [Nitratidesulfovibrio vulgaris str. Hildenborough]HBW14560.1 hypothetical protein [Desulfovibrio sp.]